MIIKYCAAAIFLVVTFVMSAACSAADQTKPNYIFAMRLTGMSSSDQAQMKNMITEIGKILSKRENFTISIKYYNDDEVFMKDALGGKMDFVFTPSKYFVYVLLKKKKYDALYTYSVLGLKGEKWCFYVNAKRGFKSIADLKNKKIVMTNGRDDYYECRKLIESNPLDYFMTIINPADILSAFYEMSMNGYDAVFASELGYKNMKFTNPGPVKDVEPILCTELLPFNPFLVSKKVPKQTAIRFRDILITAHKDEDFRTYWPLLKNFKIKFVEMSNDDFKPYIMLFEDGMKKGWEMDYQRFNRLVKPK